MSEPICSSIAPIDEEQLKEVIGYHFRVVQNPQIQALLADVPNLQVVQTLLNRGMSVPTMTGAVETLKRCIAEGRVCTVRRDGHLVGYSAYSPIAGKALQISYRANEPVALINMFRVPNPKQGMYDTVAGEALIHTLLNDLRDTTHFRLAYRIGNDNPNELSLERMMPPTALGFDDYGNYRVAGLNAADMSMGIYRRPAYLKGPSFMAPNWSR